jgi:copper chaperone NosL
MAKQFMIGLLFFFSLFPLYTPEGMAGTSSAEPFCQKGFNDIALSPACPFCGMDREKFAFSRVFIQYDDGAVFGACSLHCAAIDMAVNIDKAPLRIWVGDYNTRELIDAEKAFWVIGGNKMGVMTKRAKWAFGTDVEAKRFVEEFGGELSSFEDAAKAAYEDMYQDTRMIRKKRKMKRMRMKKTQE